MSAMVVGPYQAVGEAHGLISHSGAVKWEWLQKGNIYGPRKPNAAGPCQENGKYTLGTSFSSFQLKSVVPATILIGNHAVPAATRDGFFTPVQTKVLTFFVSNITTYLLRILDLSLPKQLRQE